MLASWVSQASFDPPGLTLAVAKGRAAEAGLTAPGARFSISLVADGKDGPVSRALAKPGAGGDRLAGLDAAPDPDTGAPVLGAGVAAAWLACTTVSGMEAGDHVVLYASVDGGRVAPGGPQSAVRLRKSGATY
jgi:flavin reductase (DIM6/NTAB) family NADH-FMN oxidoreductase RutF